MDVGDWSLRPVPRAYSSSTPQLRDFGAVSNPCGYQERRTEGIVVLASFFSMGFRVGGGAGEGRCVQPPSHPAPIKISEAPLTRPATGYFPTPLRHPPP